jgi:hypothetical protein
MDYTFAAGSSEPAAYGKLLPAVVGEGLVGLGHLVGVFATLHSGTETVGGIQDFVLEALGHRLFAAGLGVADQPAQGECGGRGPA